jgi:1-acyl-sn-glycerol-3-phosphate acyltransferase/uncharacterized protein with GYD domain
MAVYVMLSRLTTAGHKALKEQPDEWLGIHRAIERWEAKILHDFHTMGKYDHCTIFEAPDNFHAYRAALSREFSSTVDMNILPAIDLPLFQRLVQQDTGTVGPHAWQITAWAKVARVALRWHAYGRHVANACKPLTVHGREHFRDVKGPCIVIANHQSHMDSLVLFQSMPQRIKWNLYFGAAADRWFIPRPGKPWDVQPWYQSLALACYPIQRGGGSATLDYAKWLLDKGCNLCIFPEGTRSTSKQLNRFRYGVALLALEKNVPVVPVYMAGLKEMRPKGSKEIKPGPAASYILPPLHFAPGTTVPQATQMMFEAMNAMHQRYLAGEDLTSPPGGQRAGIVAAR